MAAVTTADACSAGRRQFAQTKMRINLLDQALHMGISRPDRIFSSIPSLACWRRLTAHIPRRVVGFCTADASAAAEEGVLASGGRPGPLEHWSL